MVFLAFLAFLFVAALVVGGVVFMLGFVIRELCGL